MTGAIARAAVAARAIRLTRPILVLLSVSQFILEFSSE